MAVAASLLMALRITQRDMLWLDRTYWLVGLAAIGAASAHLVIALMTARPWLYVAMFVPGYPVAMSWFFMLYNWLISDVMEPNPNHPAWSLMFGSAQNMALFLYSCSPYLLPWPLPLLAFLGAYCARKQQ